jgi:hypothetical protein
VPTLPDDGPAGLHDRAARLHQLAADLRRDSSIRRSLVLEAVRRIKGQVATLQERADRELRGGPDPVLSGELARLNSQLDRVLIQQRRGASRA